MYFIICIRIFQIYRQPYKKQHLLRFFKSNRLIFYYFYRVKNKCQFLQKWVASISLILLLGQIALSSIHIITAGAHHFGFADNCKNHLHERDAENDCRICHLQFFPTEEFCILSFNTEINTTTIELNKKQEKAPALSLLSYFFLRGPHTIIFF